MTTVAPATPSRTRLARAALYAFLGIAVLLALFPFVVMVFGSLKTGAELSVNPAWAPRDPWLGNFAALVTGETGAMVLRGLLNSFIITIPFVLLTVLLCAMAGYAFTRFEFRGRGVIFAVLIASMLVPVDVNIPALYVVFANLDWLNTYQVQILPGTASIIGMFMCRQYMSELPAEVFEAARVDGAGHWRTFWSVALPMSAPVLGAVGVLTFVGKWSEYLWPRIMVTDPDYQPIMVLLPALSTAEGGFIIRQEVLLAGAVLITIPVILVFLRFQDRLMEGVTGGAVRG